MSADLDRCPWCGDDPIYVAYHDDEWGKPLRDEHRLFELLLLEGAQAGLSWITVLKKRPAYRELYDGFDAQKMARWTDRRIEKLLTEPGIIRNRLKVESARRNARAYLDLVERKGSFADWLWDFVDGEPIVNEFKTMAEVPAETDLSRTISKELKRAGMNFVGPTILYAYMQSAGLVDDHLVSCYLRN
ncbi:MAG: DNA-3-methyladenine glycosylase I [Planctomycetota bacterium]